MREKTCIACRRPAYLDDNGHDQFIVRDTCNDSFRERTLRDGLCHPSRAGGRRGQFDRIGLLNGHSDRVNGFGGGVRGGFVKEMGWDHCLELLVGDGLRQYLFVSIAGRRRRRRLLVVLTGAGGRVVGLGHAVGGRPVLGVRNPLLLRWLLFG